MTVTASWGERLHTASSRAFAALLALTGAALIAGTGALAVHSPSRAAVAGAVLLAAAFATIDLGYVAVMAVPATLIMTRVGGALSVSDFVLFAATVPALIVIGRARADNLQPLVWLGITYQACLMPTLVLNPYKANVIEWVHEGVLVIGGLVVGWVIGWQGRARTALSAYVFLASAMGVAAGLTALTTLASTGHFEPVYLWQWHKNFIGNALAFAAILAYARPPWTGWTRGWSFLALIACTTGALAAQSKQAIISLLVGIAFVTLRTRGLGLRGWLMAAAAIPMSTFVWQVVSDQLSSDNQFNAAHQRLVWYQQSLDIWESSPVFGAGLRWWYTDRFPQAGFQPPNAELEMLTSAGLVGLLGLLVLTFGALLALRTVDRTYGTVAMALILVRFTQGQFDLFWVAGMASFAWIVAGIALGTQSRDQSPAHTVQRPTTVGAR